MSTIICTPNINCTKLSTNEDYWHPRIRQAVHPNPQQIKPKTDTRKSLYPRDRDEQLTPKKSVRQKYWRGNGKGQVVSTRNAKTLASGGKDPRRTLVSVNKRTLCGLCGSGNTRGPFCPASISFFVPSLSVSVSVCLSVCLCVCLFVCLSVSLSPCYLFLSLCHLSLSPCCIIVLLLWHRFSLWHRPPAVSSSTHSDIVHPLWHRRPRWHLHLFYIVPLLYHSALTLSPSPSVSVNDIFPNISLQSSHREGNLISLLLHHIPLSENPFGQQGPY